MEFLRKDLAHLFDEQGIDKESYEEVVEFIDPITRYNKLSGLLEAVPRGWPRTTSQPKSFSVTT